MLEIYRQRFRSLLFPSQTQAIQSTNRHVATPRAPCIWALGQRGRISIIKLYKNIDYITTNPKKEKKKKILASVLPN